LTFKAKMLRFRHVGTKFNQNADEIVVIVVVAAATAAVIIIIN